MARLALGAAGAAIGGYFGGPFGAQLGYIAGSALGQFLFPDPPVINEGPRLGDLNVAGASYGIPIRLGYGTVRMAGSLIWAGAVRENEHREEVSGGKGGAPTQVNVTYTYFASCAFMFSAGEAADILRIWLDNKLVYDKGAPAKDPVTGSVLANVVIATRKSGLNFTFYKGDETQLPDPTIESEEGAGQVPGHRGLCYIVFNDLELTDFGNRLPQVQAEIAYKAVGDNSDRFSDDYTVGEGGLFTSHNFANIGIDTKRRRIYVISSGASGDGLSVYDMNTLKEIRQKLEFDIINAPAGLGFSAGGEMSVGKDSGYIYTNAGASNTRPIIKIDPSTLTEVGRFGFESTLGGPPDTFDGLNLTCEIMGINPSPIPGEVGRKHFLMCRTVFSDFGIIDADTMTYLYDDAAFPTQIRGMTAGKPEVGTAVGWIMQQAATGNSALNIYKVEVSTAATFATGATFGVDVTLAGTIDPSTWNNDADNTAAIGPIYDETDDSLMFIIDVSSIDSFLIKWREADGVVWATRVTGTQKPVQTQGFAAARLNEGVFGYVDASASACLVQTSDGTVLEEGFDWQSITASANPTGQQVFDGQSQSIISVQGSSAPGNIGQLFLGRVSGLGELLSNIVTDLSVRVGLDQFADLDVTELTSTTVRGYSVTRQMPARQAIEPLQRAFFFDGIETDDQVVFKTRGRDPVRTIQDDDMIPLNDTFDVVQETRAQEVELPERVTVSYIDINRDYTEGAQAVKRVLNPTPTMRSHNESTVTLPIVMDADEASKIAEKTLFTLWNERTTYSWRTPWEHMDLDPADVILLQLDNQVAATTLRTRIAKAVVNLDLTVSFEGLTEDKITVVSDRTGTTGSFPQQTVPGPAFTQLFLLDIPLLRDVDDLSRVASRLYLAMQGYSPDWPGGALFDSNDGVVYGNTGVRNPLGVDHGIVLNALPDTDTPFLTDTTTDLHVIMNFGTLSSVTQTQFVNDENAALVGNPSTGNWELILFKDVSQDADGSYHLTTLMRGRRGTDANVGTHGNAETFILLNRDTINTYLLDLSNLSVTRYYKGVGYGSLPEDADVEPLASTMADLKPYAPCQLDAVVDVSDNIDLSWVRRTRVGGALIGGTGTVPLSEDTEEYEVEILDAPGGSVVRTFTGLTSAAVEYTKANITSDLGIATGSVQLDVFDGDTFTRPSGSFVSDGFVAGMTIETTGFSNGANNGVFTVTQVTATNLDIAENTLVAETGSGDETMAVIRENDITFRVYQVSAQVGRGFAAEETITL